MIIYFLLGLMIYATVSAFVHKYSSPQSKLFKTFNYINEPYIRGLKAFKNYYVKPLLELSASSTQQHARAIRDKNRRLAITWVRYLKKHDRDDYFSENFTTWPKLTDDKFISGLDESHFFGGRTNFYRILDCILRGGDDNLNLTILKSFLSDLNTPAHREKIANITEALTKAYNANNSNLALIFSTTPFWLAIYLEEYEMAGLIFETGIPFFRPNFRIFRYPDYDDEQLIKHIAQHTGEKRAFFRQQDLSHPNFSFLNFFYAYAYGQLNGFTQKAETGNPYICLSNEIIFSAKSVEIQKKINTPPLADTKIYIPKKILYQLWLNRKHLDRLRGINSINNYFYMACALGDMVSLELFVANNPHNVVSKAPPSLYQDALTIAVTNKHQEVISYLLESVCIPIESIQAALLKAIEVQPDLFTLILNAVRKKSVLDRDFEQDLIDVALKQRNRPLLDFLVKIFFENKLKQRYPNFAQTSSLTQSDLQLLLSCAIKNHGDDTVQFLLDQKADVNTPIEHQEDKILALELAFDHFQGSEPEKFKVLLEHHKKHQKFPLSQALLESLNKILASNNPLLLEVAIRHYFLGVYLPSASLAIDILSQNFAKILCQVKITLQDEGREGRSTFTVLIPTTSLPEAYCSLLRISQEISLKDFFEISVLFLDEKFTADKNYIFHLPDFIKFLRDRLASFDTHYSERLVQINNIIVINQSRNQLDELLAEFQDFLLKTKVENLTAKLSEHLYSLISKIDFIEESLPFVQSKRGNKEKTLEKECTVYKKDILACDVESLKLMTQFTTTQETFYNKHSGLTVSLDIALKNYQAELKLNFENEITSIKNLISDYKAAFKTFEKLSENLDTISRKIEERVIQCKRAKTAFANKKQKLAAKQDAVKEKSRKAFEETEFQRKLEQEKLFKLVKEREIRHKLWEEEQELKKIREKSVSTTPPRKLSDRQKGIEAKSRKEDAYLAKSTSSDFLSLGLESDSTKALLFQKKPKTLSMNDFCCDLMPTLNRIEEMTVLENIVQSLEGSTLLERPTLIELEAERNAILGTMARIMENYLSFDKPYFPVELARKFRNAIFHGHNLFARSGEERSGEDVNLSSELNESIRHMALEVICLIKTNKLLSEVEILAKINSHLFSKIVCIEITQPSFEDCKAQLALGQKELDQHQNLSKSNLLHPSLLEAALGFTYARLSTYITQVHVHYKTMAGAKDLEAYSKYIELGNDFRHGGQSHIDRLDRHDRGDKKSCA